MPRISDPIDVCAWKSTVKKEKKSLKLGEKIMCGRKIGRENEKRNHNIFISSSRTKGVPRDKRFCVEFHLIRDLNKYNGTRSLTQW